MLNVANFASNLLKERRRKNGSSIFLPQEASPFVTFPYKILAPTRVDMNLKIIRNNLHNQQV